MAWKLREVLVPQDDWWLRSQGPAVSFETEYDAQLNAKESEHPQFRRREKPVWVYVDEATGHVHTAALERKAPTQAQLDAGEPGDPERDENGKTIPIPPGDDIVPKSGADVTVSPPGERERLQVQIDTLNKQLAELAAKVGEG